MAKEEKLKIRIRLKAYDHKVIDQSAKQIIDTARHFNRKVVISGLSMQKNIEISRTLGYLNVKDDVLIDIDEARSMPDKKLVYL